LERFGISAHHIAQEHSYVPDMWLRQAQPKLLIYLDVTYEVSLQRRASDLLRSDFAEQLYRLRHARQHADCYIDTTDLTIQDVLESALAFLVGHSS
jgi:thymidylate kinase